MRTADTLYRSCGYCFVAPATCAKPGDPTTDEFDRINRRADTVPRTKSDDAPLGLPDRGHQGVGERSFADTEADAELTERRPDRDLDDPVP